MSNDVYSKFVKQLVEILVKNKDNVYIIYTNSKLDFKTNQNVIIKEVNIEN
ncbi:MAG: hypothetical protein LBF15_00010 [Candidatus Peribacteria bacterium]|nr:hypothetical protein [Candidatus Peribacteria bacterium]